VWFFALQCDIKPAAVVKVLEQELQECPVRIFSVQCAEGMKGGCGEFAKWTHCFYLSLAGASLFQEFTKLVVIMMIGINCQLLGVDHVT